MDRGIGTCLDGGGLSWSLPEDRASLQLASVWLRPLGTDGEETSLLAELRLVPLNLPAPGTRALGWIPLAVKDKGCVIAGAPSATPSSLFFSDQNK